MTYRTKTYIAGDWTGDKIAIDQLYKWNNSKYWGLTFTDAHELTQSRDTSLNCSIKQSLKTRIDASKTFLLIVGDKTNTLTAGGCHHCSSYNSYSKRCVRNGYVDYRSYISYECEKAIEADIKIVVLYNNSWVYKNKCPEIIRNAYLHIPMIYKGLDGRYYWNYNAVNKAINY